MKGTDMALLAGVAIVGYGLLKSDLFEGVGGGVGDAVGGLGAGVGQAGQAAGYNLSEVFNAVGQLGRSSELVIREGGLQSREIIRETGEGVTGILDEAGQDLTQTTDYTGDILVDVSAIGSDASGSLRSVNKGFWDAFDTTWNLNNENNIFSNTAAGVGNVFSWVKKQVSPEDKSVRSSLITGAVIAPTTPSSSDSAAGSSGGSIRSSGSSSQSSASFMESIGYQGTSTATGTTWEKAPATFLGSPIKSVRAPVVESKPWYKFW